MLTFLSLECPINTNNSVSPHTSHKLSTAREEETDDDPSYPQFPASVRSHLDLPIHEEYADVPSKIVVSKDIK